jgi:hypothetical protein
LREPSATIGVAPHQSRDIACSLARQYAVGCVDRFAEQLVALVDDIHVHFTAVGRIEYLVNGDG